MLENKMGHAGDRWAGLNHPGLSNNTENDTKPQSMRGEFQRASGGRTAAPPKQLGACAQTDVGHPPSSEPLSPASVSSFPVRPIAKHSYGANQHQIFATLKAGLLHCNPVCKLGRDEEVGVVWWLFRWPVQAGHFEPWTE